METSAIIFEDQTPASPAWDYTAKLALLFVDICDFIGLPVNIPRGLQPQNDETLFYGDLSRSGFESLSHFSHSVKKKFGKAPTEWT